MSTLLLLACTETNLAPIERPRPPARPDRSEDTGGVDGFDTGTPETDDTDDTDEPDTDTDVPIDDDCWDELGACGTCARVEVLEPGLRQVRSSAASRAQSSGRSA